MGKKNKNFVNLERKETGFNQLPKKINLILGAVKLIIKNVFQSFRVLKLQ
jgi:hypothetical protein